MSSIEKPQTVTVNGSLFYNAKDLKHFDPEFFKGFKANIRKVIVKKNISKDNYMYAMWSTKHGWKPCIAQENQLSKKAQLLLTDSWVMDNMPNMTTNKRDEKDYPPDAPPILDLEDDEKFHDNEGNAVEIETRGYRTSKGVLFLAKDVAIVFNMPHLVKALTKEDRGYEKGHHYQFYSTVGVNDANQRTKEIFITYKGMLKILFSSRTGNADKFVDWATETLFTVQMGTSDQKETLASTLIGQSVQNVRAVFNTCAKKVPCIYRFALGKAKQLRPTMDLPANIHDDFIIIKYGFTDDIERRTKEHDKQYGSIDGVQLGLMEFSYIDPKFLSEAETDIKDFFQTIEIPIEYKSFKELVAIDPKHEKQIQKQYKYIGTEYQGNVTDLVMQIKDLKTKLEFVSQEKHYEMKMKDKEIEIKQKDIDILNEKLKYESLKNEMLENKLLND